MAWAERMPSRRWRGGYRDPSGRKRYVSDRGKGYPRKTDARDAAQDAEVRSRREAAAAAGTLSARTRWGEWYDLLAPSRTNKHSDLEVNERSIVRLYLRPRWGKVPLNKVTRKAAQEWIDSIDKSPAYVRKIWSVFSMTFTKALEAEILTASPCAKVKLPTVGRQPKTYLTADQAEALRGNLRDDYQDAVEFGIDTGLRPGEICGLHASRVDVDGGWLTVNEVMLKEKRVIRPWPKDKDSRVIPLTERALEIARRRLDDRDLSGGCGVPHSDGARCTLGPLVFLTNLGRPMRQKAFGHALRKASEQAGLPKRSPYAIRRGFATRAARGGLDAFELAELMGHATMEESQEYVQQTPGARSRLRSALGEQTKLEAVGHDQDQGASRGADHHSVPLSGTQDDGGEKTA